MQYLMHGTWIAKVRPIPNYCQPCQQQTGQPASFPPLFRAPSTEVTQPKPKLGVDILFNQSRSCMCISLTLSATTGDVCEDDDDDNVVLGIGGSLWLKAFVAAASAAAVALNMSLSTRWRCSKI